jgi:hypothetical protein
MSYFVPDSEQTIPVFVPLKTVFMFHENLSAYCGKQTRQEAERRLLSIRRLLTTSQSELQSIRSVDVKPHKGVRDCEGFETLVDRGASPRTLLCILVSEIIA